MKDELSSPSVAVARWPKKDANKSEKCEKRIFAIFQLEPAASQFFPTKTGRGDFSDFSKNFRGCMGGRGSGNPNQNRNLNPTLNASAFAERRRDKEVNYDN